jgi:hypothetical protein
MAEPVKNAEIDYRRHDPYLDVIVEHTDSVGDAMARMALTARQVIRSLSESDLPAAQKALADVETTSRSFLAALARASCPEYLKGADAQIHDALKLLIDAGQRGAAAVQAMDGNRLESIAGEMDAAADDIGVAARRITDWRSGAARP